MSEMVERVAIAIWYGMKASDNFPSFTYDDWADKNEYVQCLTRRLARVAIAAMREPTDEMYNNGVRATTDCYDVDSAWRAMIDAALWNTNSHVGEAG